MRLIDANFAQHIANVELPDDEAGIVQWVLSHTPTVDAEPRKRGRWERNEWGDHVKICSACHKGPAQIPGKREPLYSNYCPSCGAKMDEKEVGNA